MFRSKPPYGGPKCFPELLVGYGMRQDEQLADEEKCDQLGLHHVFVGSTIYSVSKRLERSANDDEGDVHDFSFIFRGRLIEFRTR
jgi:hypothetical protein